MSPICKKLDIESDIMLVIEELCTHLRKKHKQLINCARAAVISWTTRHTVWVLKLFLIQQVPACDLSRARVQIHSLKVYLTNTVIWSKCKCWETGRIHARIKVPPREAERVQRKSALYSAFRSSTRKQVQGVFRGKKMDATSESSKS